MAPINFLEDTTPKWKIVAAVGGACIVGAGVYYYFNKKSEDEPEALAEKKVSPSGNGSAVYNVDSPAALMKLHNSAGSGLFRKGQYLDAIEEYTKAIEACDCNPDTKADLSTIFQNRAAAYEHLKDYEKVISNCTTALSFNNRYIKALTRRARAAEMLDNPNLALEDLTAICIIEGFSNHQNLSLVDNLLKKIGRQNAEKKFGIEEGPAPSKYAADTYLRGYSKDQVIIDINALPSAEEGEQQEEQSHYRRALGLIRAYEYPKVVEACGEAIEEGPDDERHKALLLRAIVHIMFVRREPAMQDLRTILTSEAGDELKATALVKMSNIAVSFNEYDKAKEYLSRAERHDPNNTDLYHQRGQMELVTNQMEEASASFDKAVSLSPHFPIGVIQKLHTDYRIASFKQDKNVSDEIVNKFQAVQEQFPNCAEVYLLWCQILLEEERFSAAKDVLDKLFQFLPNHPHGLVYRGMLEVQWKKNIEKALDTIKQALEIDPLCEMALEHIATISVQSGRLPEGMVYLDRAIPLSKSVNEMAHYYSLRDAAEAQINVMKRLDITLPGMSE